MAKKTWKPGESGNPNGRPAGTTLLGKLRTKHQGDIEAIFDALIILAKDGDTAAAQIIMSRMLPPVCVFHTHSAIDSMSIRPPIPR